MYDIFEKLCAEKGVTPYRVCKETGLTTSTISNWKAGRYTPKTDKMQKIADFFGVSIEFLMGSEEKEESPVYYTNEETAKLAQEMFEDSDMRSLFDMKRNMPPERFKAHMEFMKNLYNQEKGDY
ncbi:MAG: helix-turn-helix transcriptional regulator [Lachnospiraceae bacterium]|nr:helix-turn-helix transcriptional regulator [Lachnospiraceae bacterium]